MNTLAVRPFLASENSEAVAVCNRFPLHANNLHSHLLPLGSQPH